MKVKVCPKCRHALLQPQPVKPEAISGAMIVATEDNLSGDWECWGCGTWYTSEEVKEMVSVDDGNWGQEAFK